jgi:transposase-like protein
MDDSPKTLSEFESRFSSDVACADYLVRLRWPQGFVCPVCGGREAWRTERLLFHCAQGGRQVSVTAGTLFQGTRKPLSTWFRAMWWVTSQKNGASAKGLQQSLGLGSDQTAWTCLHKLRRAMVRPGRELLNGLVEVDETFVGGPEERHGRGAEPKTLVVVAVEKRGRALGRTRLAVIPNASAETLCGFIAGGVAPGSTVRTDGWPSYGPRQDRSFIHERIVHRNNPQTPHQRLPGVHLIASLLKRWLLGTHQGAVSPEHLPYDREEFTFRFNRRTSKARGLLFYRLLQQAVAVQPTTSNQLKQPKPQPVEHT